MSGALDTWYSLADLDRLARRGQPLDGGLAIERLERLAELLSSSEGTVNATLALRHRVDGLLDMSLACAADVVVVCQRCLEPMQLALTGAVDYRIAGEASAGMGDVDVLVVGEDRLNPKELIEQELLVSLPLSPRHEDEQHCGSLARRLEKMKNDDDSGRRAGVADN